MVFALLATVILTLREGSLRPQNTVRISTSELNHETTLQAEIHNFDLTGHAERSELLDFAQKQKADSILLDSRRPRGTPVVYR